MSSHFSAWLVWWLHRSVLGSPVHVTKFGLNKTNILSSSDDTTVRCWDIPTESLTLKFTEHEDYVRAGLVSSDNNDIWVTGLLPSSLSAPCYYFVIKRTCVSFSQVPTITRSRSGTCAQARAFSL